MYMNWVEEDTTNSE